MEVEIECLAGKSYSLVINDLLKPIVPSESNVKVCRTYNYISQSKLFMAGKEWNGYHSLEETRNHFMGLLNWTGKETKRCQRVML